MGLYQYSQPQASLHPSMMTNAKANTTYCGSYIAATLLSLSRLCDMLDQPSYVHGSLVEPFQDAEVFAKAHAAFLEGKALQSEWVAKARTNNYVFFVFVGINYATPAFTTFGGQMPQKSARILLQHQTDGQGAVYFDAGWLQVSVGHGAIGNAAYPQLTADLVLADPTAPAVLKDVALRLLAWAARIRTIPGHTQEPSIEAVLLQRAGLPA